MRSDSAAKIRAQSHIALLTEAHRLLMLRMANRRGLHSDPLDSRTLRCERVVRMLDSRIRLSALQFVESEAETQEGGAGDEAATSPPPPRDAAE